MSPSVIRTESRPVGPIASDENKLLESVEQAPQWAKYMIAFQQQSEQRLQNLELAVEKAGSTYVSPNQHKMVYIKFTKKLYEDQYNFNMSLYRTLENAVQIEDMEERDAHLLAGIEFIEKHNKILMLNEKHGWECAEAYAHNPLADNSDDEKKIKKALKEAKSVKEEKLKAQRISRKSSLIPKRHFTTMQCCRFLLSSQPRVQHFIADAAVSQGIMPNTVIQGYQAMDFLRDNFSNQPIAATIPNPRISVWASLMHCYSQMI